MKQITLAALGALALATAASGPAAAFFGGGGGGGGSSGGDREPAGGAFMSNYVYPGSTGVQAGGPPRSVDIPQNGYGYGGNAYGYDPYPQQRRMYRRRGE